MHTKTWKRKSWKRLVKFVLIVVANLSIVQVDLVSLSLVQTSQRVDIQDKLINQKKKSQNQQERCALIVAVNY